VHPTTVARHTKLTFVEKKNYTAKPERASTKPYRSETVASSSRTTSKSRKEVSNPRRGSFSEVEDETRRLPNFIGVSEDPTNDTDPAQAQYGVVTKGRIRGVNTFGVQLNAGLWCRALSLRSFKLTWLQITRYGRNPRVSSLKERYLIIRLVLDFQ